MPLRFIVGLLFAGILAIACAPPSTEGSRPRGTSSKKGDTGAADDDLTDPAPTTTAPPETPPPVTPPVDAGANPTATIYLGKLDATPTVRFGGQGATGNYCNYDVTLKDVVIEIAALPDGSIISASTKDTMVEASVPPCTFASAPPSAQSYAFTTATKTADGLQLAFKGAAANFPATSLVVDLVKTGNSYEASAVWHRTDQGDPLDWTVKTKITLGPR